MISVKSNLEVNRNYPDLLLVSRDRLKGYKAVMIEFKYLKKGETENPREKQEEAMLQIKRYSDFKDMFLGTLKKTSRFFMKI